MIIYYYLMIWSQQGASTDFWWSVHLQLTSSGFIEFIEALALDGWLAMTCVWSLSVEIQSFIALRLQLGFSESIRVLVKWLTKCDWMADSQLRQTHLWFRIASLGIRISHWFKLLLDIGIVTIHCLLNIQRGNQFRFWLTPFHELFVGYSLMRLMISS